MISLPFSSTMCKGEAERQWSSRVKLGKRFKSVQVNRHPSIESEKSRTGPSASAKTVANLNHTQSVMKCFLLSCWPSSAHSTTRFSSHLTVQTRRFHESSTAPLPNSTPSIKKPTSRLLIHLHSHSRKYSSILSKLGTPINLFPSLKQGFANQKQENLHQTNSCTNNSPTTPLQNSITFTSWIWISRASESRREHPDHEFPNVCIGDARVHFFVLRIVSKNTNIHMLVLGISSCHLVWIEGYMSTLRDYWSLYVSYRCSLFGGKVRKYWHFRLRIWLEKIRKWGVQPDLGVFQVLFCRKLQVNCSTVTPFSSASLFICFPPPS